MGTLVLRPKTRLFAVDGLSGAVQLGFVSKMMTRHRIEAWPHLLAVWAILVCVGFASSSSAQSAMAADGRGSIELDENGSLRSYEAERLKNLLLEPVAVRVTESHTGKSVTGRDTFKAVEQVSHGAVVSHDAPQMQLQWVERLQADGGLRWHTTLRNLSERRRELMLELEFVLDAADMQPFFPGLVPHPPWPQDGALRYGYYRWDEGGPLAIPMGSLVSRARNAGITFCADLDGFIRPMTIVMRLEGERRARVIVRRRFIRLEPQGSATSVLHLAVHAGDWRAALGWVRDRWSQHFWVGPEAEAFQLLGFGGCIPALNVDREMPYCLDIQVDPWYGDYWPDREQWSPRIQGYLWNMKKAGLKIPLPADADHRAVEAHFLKHGVPDEAYPDSDKGLTFGFSYEPRPYKLSKAFVRKYLDYLHGLNMKAMLYFCPAEAWGPYMKSAYPGGLVRGPQQFFPSTPWPDGELKPQYYNWDSYTTNPDPDLPYGRSLLGQIERLFEQLPDIDGVYVDQPFHSELDAANDDGISIMNGRPVSNTSYGFDKLMRRVRQMAHERGKIVYCNIPVRIGDARWTDIMLQESKGPLSFVRQRYFTIGNRMSMALFPFTSTTTFEGVEHGEGLLHLILECGYLGRLNSTWEAWHKDLARLEAGRHDAGFTYRPLFMALRGRSWVLEPHCLELPDRMRGNLFRTKAGNYLCPVTLPGTTLNTTWLSYDLPVVIRVSDAQLIKAAYITSPDHVGLKRLPFLRDGNRIRITIPRQRSVSMLLLAKTGRFAALPSMVLRRGSSHVDLSLDNWSDRPWRYVGQAKGFATGAIDRRVEPGASVTVPLTCDWSLERTANPRMRAWHVETDTPGDWPEIRLVQDPNIEIFECFVGDGLRVDFAPRDDLEAGMRARVAVSVFNFTATKQTVTLDAAMEGAAIDGPGGFDLDAAGHRTIHLWITPASAGSRPLTVSAGGVSVARTMKVWRRGVADAELAAVKSAWVQIDSFAQDMAGIKPWQLRINGGPPTPIAPDSGSWNGGWRSQLGIPGRFELAPKTVQSIGRSNKVTLSNSNRDALPFNTRYGLKVRDVVLGVRFEDGTEIMCPAADGNVQASADEDWRHVEGRRVPLGQDLVWRVNVPEEVE
jgi:hypothetical protein